MRLAVAAVLILALTGCRTETYRDPYLAAVNRYLASLDAAKQSGAQIDPPPEPAYLRCPVQPEPLPQSPNTEGRFDNDTIRRTASLGSLSTRSQAQCENINTARRQAYEKAMQRYQKVVIGVSVGPLGNEN
jgi:hypothetical protein